MGIVMKQRRWAVVPVAAGLVLLMLLAAVAAGLRIPGFAFLSGLPGYGPLDYRTLSGSAFAPLRADYLDELLGTGFGAQGAAAGSPDAAATGSSEPAAVAAAGPSPFAGAGPGPAAAPTTLDHELTNDDMDDAIVIRRLPFTARTDTTHASREPGEPESCSPRGGTGWYRYTATRDGLLSADTFGSDHATAVGVFRGTSLATAEQVACATGATGNAQVPFPATRGSTYLFQVTGVLGGGRLVFHLTAPGSTSMISAAAEGRDPMHAARSAHVSGDGRVVVYETGGAAAHAREVPCCGQIYAMDRGSGRTTVVSRSSRGEPGNSFSLYATTSRDGRYVAFSSAATNLVVGDTNNAWDLFVHDRRTGRTIRASVGSQGQQGTERDAEEKSILGSLSPDGRFVSFGTSLGGLIDGDPPGSFDVFVRDLRTGVTTRESVDDDGDRGSPGISFESRVSAAGRYVAFASTAQDLASARYRCDLLSRGASARGGCHNVFLRDRWQNTTRILSVDPSGNADMAVDRLDMSDDGRVVAWTTTTALDPGDTNQVSDVYVVDPSHPSPRRVSLSSTGAQQDEPGGPGEHTDFTGDAATSRAVSVSGDGTRVAFDSRSTNLVPEDGNGASDIFLRDLRTASTTRVSVSSAGAEGDGDSYRPSLSHDGSVVVFESNASNLGGIDANRFRDVFLHDLRGV